LVIPFDVEVMSCFSNESANYVRIPPQTSIENPKVIHKMWITLQRINNQYHICKNKPIICG